MVLKNNKVVERFKPLIKKALNSYLNEIINNKLQNAINNTEEIQEDFTTEDDNQIVTTDEEMEGFYIVKSILSEVCEPKDIAYKDTLSYFGILYKNKTTRWICRLYLKETVKYITISDDNKNEVRYDLKDLNDIYKLRKELIVALSKYMKTKPKIETLNV